MSNRWLRVAVVAIVGAILVAAGVFTCALYAPRRTPEGQPPLAVLHEGDLKPFEDAFNAAADSTRILALLSPT
jgi:hypothetical protein